jgi:Holliday junction DNA helicase RuvA
MLYSLSGKLTAKKSDSAVIEANGVGFKILISPKTFRQLPKVGQKAKLFVHLHVYQNEIALYGFADEEEKEVFGLLTSVDGIGPRAAHRLISSTKIKALLAAITEGRVDLLIRAAGIGSKKANRIILELKDKLKKIKLGKTADEISQLESGLAAAEVLQALGYKSKEIYEVIKNIPKKTKKIEDQIRFALRLLGNKSRK